MHDAAGNRYSHVVPESNTGPADAWVLGTGMHVWEIARTARNCDDPGEMARSLNLDRDLLEEGMRYAEEHPAAVAAAIEENESITLDDLRTLLPSLTVFSFGKDGSNDDRI